MQEGSMPRLCLNNVEEQARLIPSVGDGYSLGRGGKLAIFFCFLVNFLISDSGTGSPEGLKIQQVFAFIQRDKVFCQLTAAT